MVEAEIRNFILTWLSFLFLTFFGQHRDADTRVTEFDEGQAARRPVLLSDQKNILGTNISMNEVLILLREDMTGTHTLAL